MLMTTRNTSRSLWTRMALINCGRIPKSRPVFVKPSRGWRTIFCGGLMNLRPVHFLSTPSPVAENLWIFPSSLGHLLFRLKLRSAILVSSWIRTWPWGSILRGLAALLISIFGELQELGNSSHAPPARSYYSFSSGLWQLVTFWTTRSTSSTAKEGAIRCRSSSDGCPSARPYDSSPERPTLATDPLSYRFQDCCPDISLSQWKCPIVSCETSSSA